jgi:ATP:ADP antiporter, AAA family
MKKLFQTVIRVMEIEAGEAPVVMLLLVQSVFLGIFYGIFEPVANSLFLSAFPAEMLPKAFTVSGVVGIIMTALYSKMQKIISYSRLAILYLTTIVIFTILLWLGFGFTTSKWHVFLVLVMMGPLNILAMLVFWGTAGRLFSLRQGKRLFGLVDAGYIIGMILSSYAIPVLLTLHFKTKDLLFISAAGAIVALIFQVIATINYKSLGQKIEKTVYSSESSLRNLLKNKFVKLMAAFVVLSMVTAFFISYSFLAVTKTKYPDSNDLTKFLGAFFGTVMFFTLMMKLFVYSKFMKTYGLKVSLVLSPFLLILFTVAASVIGIFGGYTASSKGFVFFFLVIALSRLFSLTLKSSIEAPSFKTLYQTVDKKIRYHVQANVDGTINEIAALSSGVILLLMGLMSFIKLISFSQVLAVILFVWGWVAFKLYKAYKSNLSNSLANIKEVKLNREISITRHKVTNTFSGDEDIAKVLYLLKLQEITQPIIYESLIPYLLNHRLKEVKLYAIERSEHMHIYEALDTLKMIDEEEIKLLSKKLAGQMTTELNESMNAKKIASVVRSKDPSERELAARMIGQLKDEGLINHLKFLLRDIDNNVKISAIKAAAKMRSPALIPLLTELLAVDFFSPYASDALIEIGPEAIDNLENLFHKSGNQHALQLRILQIMGNIGGTKACIYLINKVNYHNIEIARVASCKLLDLKYQSDTEHFHLLHQALFLAMSIQAWNVAARASLKSIQTNNLVKRAIADEIHKGFDHLFTLLSLTYDAQSIFHVKQHIESEESESTGYAIELLELIVTEDMKPMLFPLIDDSSDNEKVRQLQYYYPVDLIPFKDLLINIINRDFNYIGKFTKACALDCLLEFEKFEISDDIIAQIFNPDELISELAACLVYKNDQDRLASCFKRLGERNKQRLQNCIKNFQDSSSKLLLNKILFLKGIKYFETLFGDKLIPLAKLLQENKYSEGDEIEGLDSELLLIVHFLISGNVKISNEKEETVTIGPGNLFGGIFSLRDKQQLPAFIAENEVVVYSIKQDLLNTIMYNNPEFTSSLVSYCPVESVQD